MNFSLNNMTRLTALAIAGLAMAAVPSHAATIFITNNTTSKTLASNEGDAAALEGDGAGDTTTLNLSTDDGGGAIDITTIAVTNSSLGMDGDSMGTGNDKWGTPQSWTFSFDKEISFDGFGGTGTGNATFGIQSSAWVGATVDDSTEDWSFDSTTGEFSANVDNFQSFDFTSAGVPNVAAGTSISIEHIGGSSGAEMTDFTITVIPEPASLALLGLGSLLIAGRQRR